MMCTDCYLDGTCNATYLSDYCFTTTVRLHFYSELRQHRDCVLKVVLIVILLWIRVDGLPSTALTSHLSFYMYNTS